MHIVISNTCSLITWANEAVCMIALIIDCAARDIVFIVKYFCERILLLICRCCRCFTIVDVYDTFAIKNVYVYIF